MIAFWKIIAFLSMILSPGPIPVPENPPAGGALVRYLGHCGYAVRTQNHLLIFDYQEQRDGRQPKSKPAQPSLASGWIDPGEIKDLKVRVFVSHSHSDHYDPVILEWKAAVPDIAYYFGWKAADDPSLNYLVGPRAELKSGGLEIATINSHHSGVPEVAWLIKVDGLIIYHNGDCRPDDPVSEHDSLKTKTDVIDLAFVFPVTKPGEKYTIQEEDFFRKFKVGTAFPMHAQAGDDMYLDFQKTFSSKFPGLNIRVPTAMGQKFVFASAASSGTPAGAGEDRFEPVRKLILEKMKKEGLPSVAVAVAQDGKIVWEEAWGMANVEKQIPATPQIMYSLASTTKPITATAVMILVERGLVDLDKPANLYLGEAKLTGYAPEAATVRRLLTHTAGLPLHWNLIFADEPYKRPDMDETIRRYGILVAPPGEEFSYANLGYGILERIIERVSGKSYADFVKSEVFVPLGMTRSAALLESGPEADVAQRYTQQKKPFPFFDFDHRGASAVYASAHDLVRFGLFHLGNKLPEQKPVLSPDGIAAMRGKRDPKVPKSNYALGWSSFANSGVRFVSHSGGMFGVGARLTLLPEKNTACVVLTNASSGMQGTDLWDVEWAILKAAVPGFPEAPEKPAPAAAPAVYKPPDSLIGVWEGHVRADGAERPAKLTIEKEGPVRLEIDGQESAALTTQTPLGALRFSNGVLLAPFMAKLAIKDTARAPHILLLGVKLRGDKLDGSLAAVAMNQRFCYPHWIELRKKMGT